MKSAILSYFFLNDVLLGQDDASVAKEESEWDNVLGGLSENAGRDMLADFTSLKQKGDLAIEESRLLLRRQLTEFLKLKQGGQLSQLFSTPQLGQVSECPAEVSGAPYFVV